MGESDISRQAFGLWAALWILALLCAFLAVVGGAHVFSGLQVAGDGYVPWLVVLAALPLLVLPLTAGTPGRMRLGFAALACAGIIALGLTGFGWLASGKAGHWLPDLCCEASPANLPWVRYESVALAYVAGGAAMLVLLVAALLRDRALTRRRLSQHGSESVA